MSKPYDASTKYLLENHLDHWLSLSNRQTTNPVEIKDTDVSTVTAAADKVLFVHDPAPWMLHVELQSSWESDLGRRVNHYNGLLEYRWAIPVQSMIVLLRKEADSPEIDGAYHRAFPGEQPYRTFRYHVVRVWQEPLQKLLEGGLGLLPLAPLTDAAAPKLPDVIHRMEERLDKEAGAEEAGNLWTATDILLGLRYPRDFVIQLLKGVGKMKESVTYQAIVQEGFLKGLSQGEQKGREEERKKALAGLKTTLIRIGTKRFGNATPEFLSFLDGINEIDRVQELTERTPDVNSWQELISSNP
jgi:predicted transposase YdaD